MIRSRASKNCFPGRKSLQHRFKMSFHICSNKSVLHFVLLYSFIHIHALHESHEHASHLMRANACICLLNDRISIVVSMVSRYRNRLTLSITRCSVLYSACCLQEANTQQHMRSITGAHAFLILRAQVWCYQSPATIRERSRPTIEPLNENSHQPKEQYDDQDDIKDGYTEEWAPRL